ncbi:MAG: pyruvate formate lyase family protein [Peptococcales bacterium]|jgi:pyruvate-formate lyase
MNARIEMLLKQINEKEHHKFRQEIYTSEYTDFTKQLVLDNDSHMIRSAKRLKWVLEKEEPVLLAGERIAFTRTVCGLPEILSDSEREAIRKTHYLHENGQINNLTPDYDSVIKSGLLKLRGQAVHKLTKMPDDDKREFLEAVIICIDAVLDLTSRYADYAEKTENYELAEILRRVPAYGAQTFREALQSFRIFHFALFAAYNYSNTIGRFDQYMWPYLKADLKAGRLDEDQAFELLEEFFLTFNKDADLYPGMVQVGDNGQSIVLGGVDRKGNNAVNPLTEMCLKASCELKLIDPKINLRVDRNTPIQLYELGSQLTKQGLGFPQYSNDDIVIPGLVALGYDLEDARDYSVAACWEFIIPGKGMEIPNIGALSLLAAVNKAIEEDLQDCKDFSEFMSFVKEQINACIETKVSAISNDTYIETGISTFNNIYLEPAPFLSLFMFGCLDNAVDISKGCIYNNYGLHGTGIANAADSLAAIKKYIFEEKSITADTLKKALEANFVGHDELYIKLKHESPKMGNDDDYVDSIAVKLIEMFADIVADKKNDRGGIYRAGTGTASYYIYHGRMLGASADGRRAGEYIPANYSPSLGIKTKGPISVIRSFTKPDLKRVINGGPLTIELHDTVFRNDDGITKVAYLVKSFIDSGGHQIQLNTINKEVLLKAQKEPENYKDLVVRVWGWSGYFVELDKEYQEHVMQRAEMKF